MRFDEFIVYCDIDGTFLKTWDHNPFPGTHVDNLKEIKRFMSQGGLFSFASGRDYKNMIRCLEDIVPNMPLISGNGGAIYDVGQDKVLYQEIIPYDIKKEFYDYSKNKADIWFSASSLDTIYDLAMNDYRDEGCFDLKRPLLDVDDYYDMDILKLAFIARKNKIDEIKEDIKNFDCYDDINAFSSSEIYYEISLKGVDKGKSILKAIELMNIKNRKIVCIGDQFNDYSMLEIADIKAAPSNAIDDVLKIADIVTVDNDNAAIADLINKLEKM